MANYKLQFLVVFLLVQISINCAESEPKFTAKDGHFEQVKDNEPDDFEHVKHEEQTTVQKEKALLALVDRIDMNHDGKLDRDEATQWLIKAAQLSELKEARERIEEYDSNNDTKVSWDEYLNKVYNMQPHEYAEALKNATGKTEDQLDEDGNIAKVILEDENKFKYADVNKDGMLDAIELKAFLTPHNYNHMADFEVKRTLEDYDKNKDGKLDIAEFVGHGKHETKDLKEEQRKRFAIHDVNKDGFITKDEMYKWVMPDAKSVAASEIDQIFATTDTNNDGFMDKDEIIRNYMLWSSSQVTNFGDHLKEDL